MLELADRVHRHVRGLEQIEQLVEAASSSRVAAIGVEQHHLAAVLPGGAVEVHADRVVERRPAVGLLLPDALDQRGRTRSAVTRDAHLGVEVDDRDVDARRSACSGT